jgi:indole-3-glycerol phosphate synthase
MPTSGKRVERTGGIMAQHEYAAGGLLQRIVAHKRAEVERARTARPVGELESRLGAADPPRDFERALRGAPPIRLIAEIKRASPSRGLLCSDFEPASLARIYEAHGAACISVLTDETFFQGHLSHLSEVRAAVDRPVLRKDFVIDEYQVIEARCHGADAVLLIAECLEGAALQRLHRLAVQLGMAALVELYDVARLPDVLACGARIIGVNNRDLRDFQVHLDRSMRLRELIPRDRLMVAESGISTRQDVVRLQQSGVDAVLVGEALVTQPDPGAMIDRLLRDD